MIYCNLVLVKTERDRDLAVLGYNLTFDHRCYISIASMTTLWSSYRDVEEKRVAGSRSVRYNRDNKNKKMDE